MDCSTPGLTVLQYLPEFFPTHVHWVNDNNDNPAISSSVPPLLLLPSVFPSIRVFSKESALCSKWAKYWSFSSSISPSNEYLGLISFRIDWFDLLAVQKTLWCFAGGPVVKNPPANSGDMGLIRGPGGYHMLWGNWACVQQLLSLCFRAQELQQEKLPQWEARTLQLESNPRLPQLQKAGTQQWRPRAAKKKKIYF